MMVLPINQSLIIYLPIRTAGIEMKMKGHEAEIKCSKVSYLSINLGCR